MMREITSAFPHQLDLAGFHARHVDHLRLDRIREDAIAMNLDYVTDSKIQVFFFDALNRGNRTISRIERNSSRQRNLIIIKNQSISQSINNNCRILLSH